MAQREYKEMTPSDPTGFPWKKLRIGMFTYSLPRPGTSWGGVATVAHTLANGLADRGHEVVVWCYLGAPSDARYQVRPLPGEALFNNPLGRRLMMGYGGNLLAPWLRRENSDVFLFHGDSLLAPLLKRPIVRIFHGSGLDESLYSTTGLRRISQRLIYELEKVACGSGPHPVAVSETTRRRFPSIDDVIPNGIDLKRFTPKAAKKTPHPSLVFVGALGGRKRGQMMLDIFSRLRKDLPNLTLDFVGELSHPPAGVTVHTGIAEGDLIALYQRAWVFVSPSLYEGFGLPYVEAMACGTAVMATPNPGSAEITDNGIYGRLVEDDDWGGALLEWLTAEGVRQSWVAKGLERAKVYDQALMLDRYETLLLRMAGP